MSVNTVYGEICRILKSVPKDSATILDVAKLTGQRCNDLQWIILEHWRIQPPMLGKKVLPAWKNGDITILAIRNHVTSELISRRIARHTRDCNFESAYKQDLGFSESSHGAEIEALGSCSLGEPESADIPELHISTGYDSFTMKFNFCPVCGVSLNVMEVLT